VVPAILVELPVMEMLAGSNGWVPFAVQQLQQLVKDLLLPVQVQQTPRMDQVRMVHHHGRGRLLQPRPHLQYQQQHTNQQRASQHSGA
jgi:hypothetical protein